MSEPSDTDSSEEYKQVVVGVCAMAKKTESKPMKEILTRLQEFEYIRTEVFPEDVILNKKVEDWPGSHGLRQACHQTDGQQRTSSL